MLAGPPLKVLRLPGSAQLTEPLRPMGNILVFPLEPCLPTLACQSGSWLPRALFLLFFYGKSLACWPEVSQLAAAGGVGGQCYRGPCSAGSWLWPGTRSSAALGVTDHCRPPPSRSGRPSLYFMDSESTFWKCHSQVHGISVFTDH